MNNYSPSSPFHFLQGVKLRPSGRKTENDRKRGVRYRNQIMTLLHCVTIDKLIVYPWFNAHLFKIGHFTIRIDFTPRGSGLGRKVSPYSVFFQGNEWTLRPNVLNWGVKSIFTGQI